LVAPVERVAVLAESAAEVEVAEVAEIAAVARRANKSRKSPDRRHELEHPGLRDCSMATAGDKSLVDPVD